MSRGIFRERDVITTGPGQCGDCHQRIVRVLVREADGRRWHTADIGNFGYVPHICPSTPPPLRKAA